MIYGLFAFLALLGVWLLVSALLNWEWYKAIIDFEVVEGLFGETVCRWFCGLSGIAIVVCAVVMAVVQRH
jgi:hypothetical protein